MIYFMDNKTTPVSARQARAEGSAAENLMPGLDDFGALRTFARVVELGSFSKAARQLGVAPSTVSKQISTLESQLGARLVDRTTRRLFITDAGERLHQRYLKIVDELRDAQQEFASLHAEPRGRLRVSLPLALGAERIAPHIPRFLERYPAVSLELDFSAAMVDVLGERFDVAVRIAGKLGEGLVGVRLSSYSRAFCASPAYLARCGVPEWPGDLAAHECLVGIGVRNERGWPVIEDGGIRYIPVSGRLIANHGDAIYHAALAGLGICMQPRWRVLQALREGRLVEVLPEALPQRHSVWAVLAQRGPIPPKVKVFIEFLKETLAERD